RKECFRRALNLDYQTLQLAGTADLMSRFTNDITVMRSGLTLLGGKVVREPLKAVACVGFALWVNWRLTLMSALFVPIMAAVFYRYGRILKQASHRMMESMARIYKSLEETFEALKIVIAFDAARRHRQRFHRENKEYYHKAMKVVQIDALTSPTTELLGMLAVSVAILPSAYLVLRGTDSIWGIQLSDGPMDIAELSVLYAFLAGIIDPVRKLSSVYAKLKRAAAATDRIFELCDREPLVTDPDKPIPLPRHSESIEFRRVSFTYAQHRHHVHRPPALEDVRLMVRAGEVLAVVGDNGSGKTTLVNLLPRYYDPDHGAVLIDGLDIRDVSLRDLRGQIGIVTQETMLFDDTIFENIRYGRPDATPEEVYEAAEKAHVTAFIDRLPEGFQTVIGPKGQRLSGGQRQRVALARAILRDPAILILDEATSAVDAQSEAEIHHVLKEFVRGRTAFVITHWITPRVLDFVTRIAVMEKGRLVATGSHDELMRTCPAYVSLYHAQQQREPAGRGGQGPDDASEPGTAAAA
ncbi:MAG TPA: ABC transporter ATP-binding protein, partial [Planctomycetaceae bacterium]|nr:ABC transporter ATP-binding protein [Planctomycetaceae bacterium]